MRLSTKAMAWTAGILWAAAIFLTGVLNLIWPGYAIAFLDMAKSIYPGYAHIGGFAGVIVGTLYALVDGLVCGVIFAWLYNTLAAGGPAPGAPAA